MFTLSDGNWVNWAIVAFMVVVFAVVATTNKQ
jgi:hypothetical protein